MQITYTNKEALQNDPEVADKNKVTAEDMNEIKTVVNTNEEELSAYITDLENNQLTGQASGESIDLSDSADSRVRSIGLEGNSEQGSTTGKNKFDGNAVTTTHPTNWTISFENDILSITHNNSYSTGSPIANLGVLPQGTYIISGIFTREIGLYRDNSYSATIRNGSTFSANGTEEIELYFSGSVESGVTDTYKKLQIELGSTATDYEPYTGGQASPNPSYPQEIHSTGDSGSVNEKVQNKNYAKSFNQPSYNQYADILDVEVSDIDNLLGKTVTISFTSDKVGSIYPNENVFTTSNTINVVSGKNSFILTFKDKIPVNAYTYSGQYLRVFKNQLATNTCTFTEVQIEQGTTATDYVAHEEQNISIPTQQPMRAIGEHKDTFVKINDNWYERHYIGQVVLNGSETYYDFRAWGDYYRVSINVSNAEVYTINNSHGQLCSHFNYNHEGAFTQNTQSKPGVFAQFRGTTGFSFVIEQSSVANWKAWLSNNNVEIIYVLATPVDLPCTEEQIEALEDLEKARTYKPVTHTSSEDTVPATIDLTYVKDLETVINNLGGA